MRIRDLHTTVEHEVLEGQHVRGYWRDHRGQRHHFGGTGYRARRGLAIGAWVFASMSPDGDWGVLDDGVVLTHPVGRQLTPSPLTQAEDVLSASLGMDAIEHHARTGGDSLPGGRL